MKTNKIQKLFLGIILCITAIPVSAQKEEWNELLKNNMQVEKDIQSLISDTTSLHQSIVSFEAKQKRIILQIDSIVDLCDKLSGDVDKKNISIIQQNVDSLNAVVKKLQDRKNELTSEKRNKENSLSVLKRDISSMGVYSAIKEEQLYSQYKEILSKPFSKITVESIREIESNLNTFSELPDFIEFQACLNSCKKNKEIYDAAEDLLNEKYDADRIENTRDKLFELLDIDKSDYRKGVIKLSEVQYSEIDTLDIKLSRYADGIAVLQGIVNAVNDSNVRENNQGNKSICVDAMRSIVFSEATGDVEKRQRYFDMIPSLNILYRKYWEELQSDPFSYPTESEIIIMQLNNE